MSEQAVDVHACPTPPTAMPGDEWTCPDCGARYFALEDDAWDDNDSAFFYWDRVG